MHLANRTDQIKESNDFEETSVNNTDKTENAVDPENFEDHCAKKEDPDSITDEETFNKISDQDKAKSFKRKAQRVANRKDQTSTHLTLLE